ncbi:MAG: polyphosphate:AMP phosphotransferase [Gemmatimonadales bacterium]|nr:polyphosphate:AMP phosphotransferase [Gemmatimonadales bacterium]
MLETAELGRTLSDDDYDAAVPELRQALLKAHFALQAREFAVVVIVAGADGAGKGEMVHHLNEWLDPRGVVTHAFWDTSAEEREHPEYWRFWRAMPGAGRIGILFGSWYSAPILERALHGGTEARFTAALERIAEFERMLTDAGTVLVKLWLHLPEEAQRARLDALEANGRLGPDDRAHFAEYGRLREVSETALARTDQPAARWHVIEATDRRWREVAAARALTAAIEAGVAASDRRSAEVARAGTASTANPASAAGPETAGRENEAPAIPRVLDSVDLSQKLKKSRYEPRLDALQDRLSRLAWQAREAGRATVMAFEGWDAAGKGSAIRRVTRAIDPRLYTVVGISAPTDEERAQHYLWRFWRRIPRDGAMTIFDRSWYGRVLVERVEGFARPDEWQRAYAEINAFERQLTDHGVVLLKFWIHVSEDEQLARFRERETVPWKRHKITPDDWRNRQRIPEYRAAVEEMLARCDPPSAPWTLVAGNDKRFARVQILETIVERLEGAL